MNGTETPVRYVYWLSPEDFDFARDELTRKGYEIKKTAFTPCQVLKSSGRTIYYAPPEVWSGICRRQGSWYWASARAGQVLLVTTERLPEEWDRFLDAEMAPSDFLPERLPSTDELIGVVQSKAYQENKPEEWEKVRWLDRVSISVMLTLKRFWGRGDSFRGHWLGHMANHANFLSRRYTTEIGGERVPYSVTENASVCSSCAEFFNVVESGSRKLVRACPGSVMFGGAEEGTYYDVKPRRHLPVI